MFTNLITCLYQYVLMNIYFILWVIIQCDFILLFKVFYNVRFFSFHSPSFGLVLFCFLSTSLHSGGFPGGSAGKESTCNVVDLDSTPGLGRSLGEWKGYPLQYSGLENSMDCIVHGVTKSLIWLSDFHFHLLDLQNAPGLSCVVPALTVESDISPRSPSSFYCKMILETKIWATDLLIAIILPGLLSWQSKEVYTCIPTLIIHTSTNISMYLIIFIFPKENSVPISSLSRFFSF